MELAGDTRIKKGFINTLGVEIRERKNELLSVCIQQVLTVQLTSYLKRFIR